MIFPQIAEVLHEVFLLEYHDLRVKVAFIIAYHNPSSFDILVVLRQKVIEKKRSEKNIRGVFIIRKSLDDIFGKSRWQVNANNMEFFSGVSFNQTSKNNWINKLL